MSHGLALEFSSGMALGGIVFAQQIEIKYPGSASSREGQTFAADADRNAGLLQH